MKNSFTKNKLLLFLLVLYTSVSFAQAPSSTNYQAVVRDNTGTIIASHAIGLQFIIHSGTATGPTVYEETWSTTSNTLGLVNVNVGQGTIVSGTFGGINWSSGGPFYLEVDMDPSGGTSYTAMGTQQMLSVPYALNAATVNTVGQSVVEVAGTSAMTITKTSTSFAVVPGLTTTITVPANSLVMAQTYGGFVNGSGSVTAMINVALFVDGSLYGTPAYQICYVTNTASQQLVGSWNFSQLISSLSPGTHTIAIEADYNFLSNTGATITVGNAPGNVPNDELIVTILKQ